ncbi:hypothetical protein Tco_0608805 [Tanacetum coccineum]
MTPLPGFSTPSQIPNNTPSKISLVITTVFAANTPENTLFAYRASTSANPNPMISPAFVEANYEVLESLLRERRSEKWNQDLSPTGKLLQPFGQGLLWSVGNEKELWDLRKHRTGKEAGEEEMPKPFIPSSLHTPTRLVPIHVNRYSQPSTGLVNGQTPNFPFQTQIGNPLLGASPPTIHKGGIYHNLSPTMAYPHKIGSFADSTGFVTPFVRWIEDYPLSDGLKMPSDISSYDGKGD